MQKNSEVKVACRLGQKCDLISPTRVITCHDNTSAIDRGGPLKGFRDDSKKFSDEAQSPQGLTESDDAKHMVRLLRHFHLGKSDAVLIATLQAVIGFGLIAALDMPWSLLGYAFVVASARVFTRMNAILAEFDRTDDDGVHFDNDPS